mmetsp:Transcript_24399/g.48534  ORF Transcript_24399/g.48534 Transcript_24399/m.48534 type:complete len:360 (+) Transcript_24399:62-1141(+)
MVLLCSRFFLHRRYTPLGSQQPRTFMMLSRRTGVGVPAAVLIAILMSALLSNHVVSSFQSHSSFSLNSVFTSSLSSALKAVVDDRDEGIVMNSKRSVNESLHSRRGIIRKSISTVAVATAYSSILLKDPSIASARAVSVPLPTSSYSSSIASFPERDALLTAISQNSSDDIILAAIQNLLPLNPLKSSPSFTYKEALDGTWKLLYTSGYSTSPLLKLPPPFRPNSYQYFGGTASREVGEGRVAQGLTGGLLLGEKQLWLSSGAVPSNENPSILEIYPPFRFQFGQRPGVDPSSKKTIVEANSDADFRAVNARTKEAQEAPKNEYEQLYVENFGRGSLRVSVVSRGDPIIVGEMFVHQKL